MTFPSRASPATGPWAAMQLGGGMGREPSDRPGWFQVPSASKERTNSIERPS